MAKLRLAVVTDIHYGPDIGNKMGTAAPRLLDRFTAAVNKYNPDCVVDMGDRFSCRNPDTDIANLRKVKEHFNAVAAPVHHVIGNHDVRFITRADNEDITGSPATSYSRDYNGYHLTFWNPNVRIGTNDGLVLSAEDIEWLRNDLASTDKPVILFSHVPLDNDPQDYDDEVREYTNGIAGRFYYKQGQVVRQMLEECGKVILCMAGHRHTKRHRDINGIHYITQQSLTSAYSKRSAYGAFSFVEIDDAKIDIRMQGRDRKGFVLTPNPQPALN